MKFKRLEENDVMFHLNADYDDMPVRGNAMCSGDDEIDKEYEDAIIKRLDDGDLWAWAAVEVEAFWNGFKGFSYLGGCSFEDEADFVEHSGYYEVMKKEALADLNNRLASIIEVLDKAGIIKP